MLRFLFPTLTDVIPRGSKLFARVVTEARSPSWYAEYGVPDTLDGRFSVVANVTALTIVRLERGGEDARQASVALTERFVESMDHEHRQLGYGDPTIGKIVRKLTGAMARRAEQFRAAVDSGNWESAAAASIWAPADAEPPSTGKVAKAMAALWQRLERTEDARLIEGEWA